MSVFDSDEYKPVPPDAYELHLMKWGCGDECGCNAMQIWARHPQLPGTPYCATMLWEGNWFWFDVDYDVALEDIKKEARKACEHYGIDFKFESDDYWGWEATKKLGS